MKVFFLDIDGVLNYHNSPWIDDRCLGLVHRIALETGALAVLSSDWRESVLYPERCNAFDNRRVNHLMYESGLTFAGVTPDLHADRRELEVAAWLKTPPESVESFVILDDLDFGFPQMFPDHFVKTSGFFKSRLTEPQAARAIQILSEGSV